MSKRGAKAREWSGQVKVDLDEDRKRKLVAIATAMDRPQGSTIRQLIDLAYEQLSAGAQAGDGKA